MANCVVCGKEFNPKKKAIFAAAMYAGQSIIGNGVKIGSAKNGREYKVTRKKKPFVGTVPRERIGCARGCGTESRWKDGRRNKRKSPIRMEMK